MHEGVVSQMIEQVSCPLYSELNEIYRSVAIGFWVCGSAFSQGSKQLGRLLIQIAYLCIVSQATLEALVPRDQATSCVGLMQRSTG